MNRLRALVIHPFLLAAHPILFLYSRNMGEVSPGETLYPLATALVAASVLYLLFRQVLRDRLKAGVVVSVAALMFFLYAPVFERFVHGMEVHGLLVGRHRTFLPIWGLAFAAVPVLVARARRGLDSMTYFLNMLGTVLVVITLFTIAVQAGHSVRESGRNRAWEDVIDRLLETEQLHPPKGNPLRDVYYIILDEYGRSDILRRFYYCDNGAFIQHLRSKGFYVADRSRSNYLATYPSLLSSLNLDHIETLSRDMGRGSIDLRRAGEMIRNNRVCRSLQRIGYKFIFFPTRYQVTCRNPYADLCVSAGRLELNEFDRILFYSSVLQGFYSAPYAQRANLLYQLEQLKAIPRIQGPKFTFAHILCPHEPYVFDSQGNLPEQSFLDEVNPHNRAQLYADQVTYISKKIEEVIDAILSGSKVRPVVIVQGDHGPWPSASQARDGKETARMVRSSILNAYYLPDGGGAHALYPTISPVNSFRVVFNRYFGGRYKLLPDTTYDVNLSPTQPCTRFRVVKSAETHGPMRD